MISRPESVQLTVLSVDAAATAAAIARDAGLGPRGEPLEGRDFPLDPEQLARLALGAVIGRISPEGKRRVVEALRGARHYVAIRPRKSGVMG